MTALATQLTPTTVDEALDAALQLGALALSPGSGSTVDLWQALATIAAHDLGAARAVEPHLDALAILQQAAAAGGVSVPATHGVSVPTAGGASVPTVAHAAEASTWGVFAAEGGNDPLKATRVADGWRLSGTKPWCSLAGRLDRALVSAHLDSGAVGNGTAGNGQRALFAVDLRNTGIRVINHSWHARGLVEIPSGPVHFTSVAAEAVGDPGWYLSRPGFAWGGIGVAACWFGGAVAIARTVFAAARDDKPFVLMHLGAIDELVETARRALAEAAELIDSHANDAQRPDDERPTGGRQPINGGLLALRVRATVSRACEEIIDRAGHALGPAPLALDAAHAKRVADLQLYIRQHHGERDQHALGMALLTMANSSVTTSDRVNAPW